MSTPKVKMNVKEMKGADVTFVSLVGRGANRIPFRIVKQAGEGGMIDLAKLAIGRILKGAPDPVPADKPSPEIVGVAVEKTDNFAEVTSILEQAGFNVSDAEEQDDGTVIFKQADFAEDEVQLVRMSDQMVAIVKAYRPYDMEGAEFMDVVKANGFHMGLDSAVSALRQCVSQKLYNAKDPADATSVIKSVCEEFAGYVASLASNIPTKAFKADQSLQELAEKAFKDKDAAKAKEDAKPTYTRPMEVPEDEWDQMSDEEKGAKLKAKKEEEGRIAAEEITKAEKTDKPVEQTVEQLVAAAFATALPQLMATLKNEVAPLIASHETLVRSLDVVKNVQGEMQAKVDAVVAKADKVEKAVSGAVTAVPPGDSGLPVRKSIASTDALNGGYYDSAYHGPLSNN